MLDQGLDEETGRLIGIQKHPKGIFIQQSQSVS